MCQPIGRQSATMSGGGVVSEDEMEGAAERCVCIQKKKYIVKSFQVEDT